MLRWWLSLGLALSIGTACTGGPQPDPPGGDIRDSGAARRDSGAIAIDAAPADAASAIDSGPPADIDGGGDAGTIMDGAIDGAVDSGIDAGEDSGPPDAGVTCVDYCNCMIGMGCLRPGDGRTRIACMMDCAMFTPDQLRCRTMHCGYATEPESPHCMHAMGIGMCE